MELDDGARTSVSPTEAGHLVLINLLYVNNGVAPHVNTPSPPKCNLSAGSCSGSCAVGSCTRSRGCWPKCRCVAWPARGPKHRGSLSGTHYCAALLRHLCYLSRDTLDPGLGMTPERIFIPQETLDRWHSEEEVQLDDDVLTRGQAQFALESAVLIVSEVTGAGDSDSLEGRVKTHQQLKAIGADHCHDSVIVGERAYSVVEGFLGSTVVPLEKASAKAAETDLDLLAKLFLNARS